MNHSFQHLTLAISALLLIAFTGCKENTVIKTSVLPNNSGANLTSIALPVYATTIYDDTIVTGINNSNSVYMAAGTFKEAFYGKTTASMYFQVVPQTLTLDLTTATIDSTVLVLPYSGFTFGNVNATQTFVAKRINDASFSVNNIYYASQSFITSDVMTKPVTVSLSNLSDSVPLASGNVAPHLRMKIDPSFNSLFLTKYSTQSAFLSVFNGICVSAIDTNAAASGLPYFYLSGSDTYSQANVVVYYHLPGDTTAYNTSYGFTSSVCARSNRVTRNYNGYPIMNYFGKPNTLNNTVVLQNRPGAAIDLKIPGIKTIPMAIINKAELSIECFNYDTACPPTLDIRGISKSTYGTDSIYTIEDRFPTYSAYAYAVLDGTPHIKGNTTTYILNIPREVLNAVKASKDTLHLRLNGTSDFFGAYYFGAYRMTGGNIKLNIVYSTLK